MKYLDARKEDGKDAKESIVVDNKMLRGTRSDQRLDPNDPNSVVSSTRGTPRTSTRARGEYTREQLEEKGKDQLIKLAEKANLTVTRADGEDGEPLKDDYIDALLK